MKNIRKFLIAAAFMAVCLSAQSQVRLGLRGGVHFAKQTFELEQLGGFSIGTDEITAFVAGGLAEITIAGDFAIQPELVFVRKGGKIKGEDDNGEKISTKIAINQIDLPLLLKIKFGGEKIGAYLAAGPTLGYALNGTTTENGNKQDIDFEEEEYKRFEVGFSLGGGIGITAGPGQVFLDLRYMFGINDLSTDEEDLVTVKNKAFGISLGYIFPLGK